MTSFIVITLEIGQSAGKKPKFVMVRIWFSLRDVENNAKTAIEYLNSHYE